MTSLSSSGYGNNMQQTVLYPLQLAWWQLNAKTNGHGIGIPSFNDIFTSQVSISSSHSRTQMAAKFFKDPCASKLVLLQLSPTSTPLSARFRKKNPFTNLYESAFPSEEPWERVAREGSLSHSTCKCHHGQAAVLQTQLCASSSDPPHHWGRG